MTDRPDRKDTDLPPPRPSPRREVDALGWRALAQALGRLETTLMGLWGDHNAVHLCLLAESGLSIASLAVTDGQFPSVAQFHAPALRLERTIQDLYGFRAVGCPDPRAWLDHREPYEFLAAIGPGIHHIPVGPIHAGIIEPGHFRFSVHGETVVRLEQRLGYCHRGLEQLLVGRTPADAAMIVARVSGDSTVAYSLAFCRALEIALDVVPPPRAQWLRALMAEIERVANHLNDIGFICNDAAMSLLQAHFGLMREELLQLAEHCFGHRLMMDRIIPGGVAGDLDVIAQEKLRDWLEPAEKRFDGLIALYDNLASLKDRTVGTGILSPELARRFGAGGFVGRASGRDFDARKALPYAPYDQLDFTVTVLNSGDVNARLWVRQAEVRQSLALIRQILSLLPRGDIQAAVDPATTPREGLALVEGFRGDILLWLDLSSDGRVRRCHPRDPSWFHWPLLEAAILGNIVADFPLCNKSFNPSYAGVDL